MKCPKCSYLGFETGDRCRNCGYDFSLLVDSEPAPIDIDLELRAPAPQAVVAGARTEQRTARDSKLPLFTPLPLGRGDEPLIKLPVAPRPPLAVRRTPDNPRRRVAPGTIRSADPAPVLEFDDAVRSVEEVDVRAPFPSPAIPRRGQEVASVRADVSNPIVRVVAAAIDHAVLAVVDLAVVYFTLRISGLSMDERMALPLVPLMLFLLLLKIAYFYAFTAVGGQTIGKMALRIRVVGEDHESIDATLALRRTLLGAASTAAFGLGLLPAFFDPERRAFHDRMARTRVIALRTA